MLSGNHFVILYLQKNLCNSFAGVEILLRFAHQDDREWWFSNVLDDREWCCSLSFPSVSF